MFVGHGTIVHKLLAVQLTVCTKGDEDDCRVIKVSVDCSPVAGNIYTMTVLVFPCEEMVLEEGVMGIMTEDC